MDYVKNALEKEGKNPSAANILSLLRTVGACKKADYQAKGDDCQKVCVSVLVLRVVPYFWLHRPPRPIGIGLDRCREELPRLRGAERGPVRLPAVLQVLHAAAEGEHLRLEALHRRRADGL